MNKILSKKIKGKVKGTDEPLPTKKCQQCGKTFRKSPETSYEMWTKQKRCSPECYYESQKSKKKKILEEHNNNCDRCGKTKDLVIHHNSYLFTNDTNHLSVLCRGCHSKLHRELQKSENLFRGENKIKRAVIDILDVLKIDRTDENFRNTPARVSRMYMEMCEGLTANEEIGEILSTKFPTDNKGMVVTKDIEVYSLCPHPLLPVRYIVDVGIIFKENCIGLSKIPRLVELLAKRPILQEQLTQEIVDSLNSSLDTLGTICVVNGVHSCMQARGVKATGTSVTTSAVTGIFLKPEPGKTPKEEFLRLINHH